MHLILEQKVKENMRYKNALVTGGAGFIGGHLAHKLVEKGVNVRVLDNLTVGKKDNVPQEAELLIGDIRDSEIVARAVRGAEVVFHLAAKVSIRAAVERFYEDADINTMGTLSVLRASRDAHVRKFIYASSMAVYGNPHYSPQDENHPKNPTSPYGVSKFASENYINALAGLWGMEYVNLRLFNTYGTRQTPSPYVGVITIFIRNILQGKPLQIFGDGKQRRDFIYVGDVVNAFILASEKDVTGVTLNVGTGIPTDINTLADLIVSKMGQSVPIEHTPPVPGEPGDSIADTRLAEQVICFRALESLYEKIDEVIEWNSKELIKNL